jgi:hypothetical protein
LRCAVADIPASISLLEALAGIPALPGAAISS